MQFSDENDKTCLDENLHNKETNNEVCEEKNQKSTKNKQNTIDIENIIQEIGYNRYHYNTIILAFIFLPMIL